MPELSSLFVPFLLGLVAALAGGAWMIPVLRRLKAGQTISTDAPERHLAKGGTPTMGGAIILSGGLIGSLAVLGWAPRDLRLLAAVGLCTFGFGLIGFIDDYLIIKRGKNLGLRAREKLLLQFLVAIAFVWWHYVEAGSPGPWVAATDPVALGPFGGFLKLISWPPLVLAYEVLLLVGMSNAVNLTDGLDGLAAGVSLPVWIGLALLAAFGAFATIRPGEQPVSYPGVATFCAAMAGGTLGYLWYNAHPAQVFMGDTGSLAIGGGIAAAAIACGHEWTVLLLGLVHVVEAGSVTAQVISFKTTGRRILKMSPLHHHFELCDWPETRIVARFAIASTLCVIGALAWVMRG
ncbi:MAG: phospho-N-acetylmuramoyl-pentapeptide-transferase [Armatimonadota bacterium]